MIVLPSIGAPFFTEVMHGIRSRAAINGYSLVIEETQDNTISADEVGTMLVSNQTDGVILLASLSPFGTEILSVRSHRRIPIVVGCESIAPELTHLPSVQVDNVAAAADATNHLIDHGHRHIAMISGQPSSLLTRDRELGYRQAMQQAGPPVEEGRIVNRDLSSCPFRPRAALCLC